MRQRDFRQQDQRLPPGPQRIGHRLEEHLGLAAACHAIQQGDPEGMRIERRDLVQRRLLFGVQHRDRSFGVRRQHHGLRRHLQPLHRPSPLQSLDH